MKRVLFLSLVLAVASMVCVSTSSFGREIDDIRVAIRASGAEWVAGETSMTRLSPVERMKRLGLILPRETGRERLLEHVVQALPPFLDWRDNGGSFVTPVRDQGGCASC